MLLEQLNKRIANIEIPVRMRNLKVSDEGYPVPWFVPWYDGKWEFRGMDSEKFKIAIRHKKCWLCGDTLGVHMTFVLGPMCIVTRTTSEPPCHHDCAEYAVRACPFLTQPRMRRNEVGLPEERDVAGTMIKRNPGVTALWTTRSYKLFRAEGGSGVLFTVGDPEKVEWYAESRRAKREEVIYSIDTGLPILAREASKDGPEAVVQLKDQVNDAMRYIPQE